MEKIKRFLLENEYENASKNFAAMTVKERAGYCVNLVVEGKEASVPGCSDHFNINERCGYICCGYCSDYAGCDEGRCKQVWIDFRLVTEDPRGRLHYVVLETGELVSGSIPCLISEMYDDNE